MTKPMKSTVIICADDFGISAGVNKAILDLAAKGRISAVSCMSLGAAWESGARELKPLHDRVSVGLHVTLTYLPPLVKELGARHPSELGLLLQSWGRRLDKALIEKEIRMQFENFIKLWGAPPDFIDGHQHVHVLPVIRDILLRLRQEYAPDAWMRNVVDLTALAENHKYAILAVMGWRWLRLLKKHKVAHNKYLRGTYNYSETVDYKSLMKKWINFSQYRHPREGGDPASLNIMPPHGGGPDPRLREGGMLIYCHPGFPDAELAKVDTVLEPRQREYDFFNSDAFAQMNITLARHP